MKLLTMLRQSVIDHYRSNYSSDKLVVVATEVLTITNFVI